MTKKNETELENELAKISPALKKASGIFDIPEKVSKGEITDLEAKEKYAAYEKEIKETEKILNKLKKLIKKREKEERES